MSAEVFGGAVVDDVAPMLERALEVRTHHGVIGDDDSVWGSLLDFFGDGSEVSDFEQRICWRFE